MDLGLKGKNVLVTGGSKGIGLAVAEAFAAEGANVAICARNAEQVGSVVKSLAAKGVVAWGDAVNVADPVALRRWVESAAVELAGIDILVCNVSALAVGNTPETWENSFRVDMMHTVNSVAAALPFLEKSKSASIVIVSSVSGFALESVPCVRKRPLCRPASARRESRSPDPAGSSAVARWAAF